MKRYIVDGRVFKVVGPTGSLPKRALGSLVAQVHKGLEITIYT